MTASITPKELAERRAAGERIELIDVARQRSLGRRTSTLPETSRLINCALTA